MKFMKFRERLLSVKGGKRWTMNIKDENAKTYRKFMISLYSSIVSHSLSIWRFVKWATLACRRMFEINYLSNFFSKEIREY